MAAAETLPPKFHQLIGFIDDVIIQVDSGTIPDLDDLDEKVNVLCREVLKAGTSTAQDIKPLMGEMISRLDTLEASLNAFQARAQEKTA